MCANTPLEDPEERSRDSEPPPPPSPAPNSSEADLASEESLTTFIDNWEVKNESRIAPTMHFNHGRFYIIKNQLV